MAYLNKQGKLAAFTLIELLIAVAIVLSLALIGVMNLVGYRQNQDLNSATQKIVMIIRNAQDRSFAQENGNRWGVHFENPSSGSDFYELFEGLSYASGTIVAHVVLNPDLQFNLPASGSSSTIIFSPITGWPDVTSTIKISLINTPTNSSTININTNGQIQY